MNTTSTPIIQATELLHLPKSENLIIVDVSNGKNAKANYDSNHLEGALFVDLNTQLAEIKDDLSIGGRHPLPNMETFATTLSNLGIATNSHVILYDDQNGSNAAARFWWMLKAIGHEKVQVLDGGIQAATQINFPLSSKPEITTKATLYEVDHWRLLTADMTEVAKASQSENHLVIDVRAVERYNGITEPIDLIAGHIPGAINIPFTENLDEEGLFLAPNLLKLKYEKVVGDLAPETVIVHCGSGVTACHTLLAFAYAGLKIPKLYVGSWSEWSRNTKPIAQ